MLHCIVVWGFLKQKMDSFEKRMKSLEKKTSKSIIGKTSTSTVKRAKKDRNNKTWLSNIQQSKKTQMEKTFLKSSAQPPPIILQPGAQPNLHIAKDPFRVMNTMIIDNGAMYEMGSVKESEDNGKFLIEGVCRKIEAKHKCIVCGNTLPNKSTTPCTVHCKEWIEYVSSLLMKTQNMCLVFKITNGKYKWHLWKKLRKNKFWYDKHRKLFVISFVS